MIIHPPVFAPTSSAEFKIQKACVEIPKGFILFEEWDGETIGNTFGGSLC